MKEETKTVDLVQRVADLERLCNTYKEAWSGYHPLADYMQQLSDADKLPVGVLGGHYGDIAVEHMRAQDARITQAIAEARADGAEEMLAWVDRDCGRQLTHIGGRWYTRLSYGMPVRRHPNLSDAVVFAMTDEKMKEAK